MTGRPRLVIALVVASLLSVFLIYNTFAGVSTLIVTVSQLRADDHGSADKTVTLAGTVVRKTGSGDTARDPLRFTLADFKTHQTVQVRYVGEVPDAFQDGRSIVINGRLDHGVFVGVRDSLLTKCPSHYSPGASAGA
jgi:cytochrome c-type biogenesis protein CcmE